MKVFKKMTATFLTIAMAGFMLAGCGSSPTTETDTAATEQASAEATTKESTEPAADATTETTGGDGDQELSVTLWNYDTTPEFKALFEAFEAENPGVTIKPIDIEAASYDDKITTMLAGGDTTDILTMKQLSYYANYASRGQLLDLTDHINNDVDTSKSQGMYEQYELDGKIYAQPYRTDFWVLYYNKDLFDQAGLDYPENITWEEYETLAKTLTSGEGSEKVYGAYQHSWRSIFQALAGAQNGKALNTPPYDYLKDYYDRSLRMQDEGTIMDYGTIKSIKVTYKSQFETQKAAMMPMGTWYMSGVLDSKNKGDTTVNWGIAPIPQKSDATGVTTFGSPTAFSINKNSKNPELAQKFIDFATGEEGAKILAGIGTVPAYKTDEIDEIYFSLEGMPTDELSKKAYAPDTVAIEFPVDVKGAALDKILQEEHDLIMVKDETPEEGIANMDSRVAAEIN